MCGHEWPAFTQAWDNCVSLSFYGTRALQSSWTDYKKERNNLKSKINEYKTTTMQ